MNARRLLLLSNSTNYGGRFLEHALSSVGDFLAGIDSALFVPYAAVRFSFDDFATRVRERFGEIGCSVQSVHAADDPVAAARDAEAIVVGGGNTFHLLKALRDHGLVGAIRERVLAGAPYVGWSAGSVVACPTIGTTNDMPIVDPPGLAALHLVPFQINPHYTGARIPKHGGETRAERLLEFVTVNPDMPVLGLREGSMLRVEGDGVTLLGDHHARIYRHGEDPEEVGPGDSLGSLMEPASTT